MTRAVALFEVRVRGQRLRVRVVADRAALRRAWRAGAVGRLGADEQLHGFFQPGLRGAVGTIVLAQGTSLAETVPHECAHAAVAALRRRLRCDWPAPLVLDDAGEETLATLAGLMTRSVLRRLAALRIEVR